jgi:hypothetical protein
MSLCSLFSRGLLIKAAVEMVLPKVPSACIHLFTSIGFSHLQELSLLTVSTWNIQGMRLSLVQKKKFKGVDENATPSIMRTVVVIGVCCDH